MISLYSIFPEILITEWCEDSEDSQYGSSQTLLKVERGIVQKLAHSRCSWAKKSRIRIKELELQVDNFVKTGKKITVLSEFHRDPRYLMACYYKFKSEGGALTKGLNETTLYGINEKWFLGTAEKTNNGLF